MVAGRAVPPAAREAGRARRPSRASRIRVRIPFPRRAIRAARPDMSEPVLRFGHRQRVCAHHHESSPEQLVRSQTVFLALLASAFVLPLAPVCATEWVVNSDGSAQFTDIQAAVDAAQDGDLVRVMPGSYGKVSILHKLVSLLGTDAAGTTIASLRIMSAPAGFVNISALTISSNTGFTADQATIVLRDCTGEDLHIGSCQTVFVENWHGRRGTSDTVGALWITSSEFVGAQGKDAVWAGTPGSWRQLPTPGMSAFGARHSTLFVANSTFTGGDGGQGSCVAAQGFLAGKSGGNGLEDETGDCSFWLSKSAF